MSTRSNRCPAATAQHRLLTSENAKRLRRPVSQLAILSQIDSSTNRRSLEFGKWNVRSRHNYMADWAGQQEGALMRTALKLTPLSSDWLPYLDPPDFLHQRPKRKQAIHLKNTSRLTTPTRSMLETARSYHSTLWVAKNGGTGGTLCDEEMKEEYIYMRLSA
ncbi:hypothetical protein P171DRAFT_492307 [Karstenula rhodostoma CBS 690.94]|uniref:Uncharacterized protein n=1 Tax=Karstenula rhodostoma CBS 690.94 TaxID=1392251 RepID=A0A9P4P4P9_9PLEO|nr:hypothetical protein P171DRAFT_492307 [Karstenula rhodostoma CBS 690.94]